MNRVEPRPFRWTKEGFYQAFEANLFLEHRVQLIDGEIVEFDARTNLHSFGVEATRIALRDRFGPDYWVRILGSLDLSAHSVADPDIAVVAGGIRTHRRPDNPTTALLVVEVADTTLTFDRAIKANLYASTGIADYWILNLIDRRLEVYRDPAPDTKAPFGWTYASRTDLLPGATVSPLALPDSSIYVVDLLP
jgi:Uma2 family endonuclease